MRDHDRGAIGGGQGELLRDRLLSERVERTRRLVVEHEWRVLEQGTRDRDALTLSSRQRQTALADACPVALGELARGGVEADARGDRERRRVCRLHVAILEIVQHRVIEEDRVLRHVAQLLAQRA